MLSGVWDDATANIVTCIDRLSFCEYKPKRECLSGLAIICGERIQII